MEVVGSDHNWKLGGKERDNGTGGLDASLNVKNENAGDIGERQRVEH